MITSDDYARWLYLTALDRMQALNVELAKPAPVFRVPWKLREMQCIAQSRLADYFEQVEKMLIPIANTHGDLMRAI